MLVLSRHKSNGTILIAEPAQAIRRVDNDSLKNRASNADATTNQSTKCVPLGPTPWKLGQPHQNVAEIGDNV